ncbi:MAG: hypothetical protein H6744_13775 [Deltaproteobacteria bacterium]|nr:hypothetical protein [Deltaproteobacteria bacterium]
MSAKRGKGGGASKSGGGSLMNLRTGVRKVMGQHPSGKRKQDVGFLTVLAWMAGIALLIFFVWSFTR